MGRHKKYITDKEKIQANRDKFMRYYERNKEAVKKRNLMRYYEKKNHK